MFMQIKKLWLVYVNVDNEFLISWVLPLETQTKKKCLVKMHGSHSTGIYSDVPGIILNN